MKTLPVTDEDAVEIAELLKDPEWPRGHTGKAVWREAAVLSLMTGVFYRVWWNEDAVPFVEPRPRVNRARERYISAKDFFPGNY